MNAVAHPQGTARLPLDIGVQRFVGLVEVVLDGSLDEGTVEDLRRALDRVLSRGATAIELDLTELVDLDGFGLALLLDAHRHVELLGGQLVLRHAQPPVLDRLRRAALDDVLILAA